MKAAEIPTRETDWYRSIADAFTVTDWHYFDSLIARNDQTTLTGTTGGAWQWVPITGIGTA